MKLKLLYILTPMDPFQGPLPYFTFIIFFLKESPVSQAPSPSSVDPPLLRRCVAVR